MSAAVPLCRMECIGAEYGAFAQSCVTRQAGEHMHVHTRKQRVLHSDRDRDISDTAAMEFLKRCDTIPTRRFFCLLSLAACVYS